MKRLFFLLFFIGLTFGSFAQNIDKLYSYYQNQNYEKCINKCDAALKKNPECFEAYYIKAIAYFDISQYAESKYKEFTHNPLMDCLKCLSILSAKDPDRTVFEEHPDTLALIKKYCESRANEIKTSNRSEAIAMYQRLSSAFKTKNDPLEFARIDAQVGDYEKCMSKVSKLYEKAPDEISTSHDDYEALTQGALLLAENWMFRDLFWLIENYKTKFAGNYGISEGFKKALLKSIDTARTDDDKTLFREFSQKGMELYPEDKQVYNHIKNRWEELINSSANAYRATATKERTWRDSVLLRNAYKYTDMARNIFPEEKDFISLETKLNNEFHTIPFSFEKDMFRKFALESVNGWRSKGCECDTGAVVYEAPVPTILWDSTLERLANEHARDMFFNNYTDAVNLDKETPWDRINKTRYKGTFYEVGKDVHFVQAMKMAVCVGYGYSFNGIYEEQEIKAVIDSVVNKWMYERLSQNCLKIMTPDVTHMAIGMYGDKWVFWAITQYDIIQRRKK